MKFTSFISTTIFFLCGADAFAPQTPNPLIDFQKAAAGAFAAFTIATSSLHVPPADAITPVFSSSNVISEKVVREGVYREYEFDLGPQTYDDARSTYKSASETKTKKGKYTALLAVLIVGSFVIPMAQYFWYVRDDDSTDKFFSVKQRNPEPEPPKKKGWF